MTLNSPIFSDREADTMDAIIATWNAFKKLPPLYDDEINDFRRGIVDLQRMIMARPIVRLGKIADPK